MALTVTFESNMNTNYSMNSHVARGLKISKGTFSLPSTYAASTMDVGIPNPIAVFIPTLDGYVFDFDITSGQSYGTGHAYRTHVDLTGASGTYEGALVELTSGVDISSKTLRFVAFGY